MSRKSRNELIAGIEEPVERSHACGINVRWFKPAPPSINARKAACAVPAAVVLAYPNHSVLTAGCTCPQIAISTLRDISCVGVRCWPNSMDLRRWRKASEEDHPIHPPSFVPAIADHSCNFGKISSQVLPNSRR